MSRVYQIEPIMADEMKPQEEAVQPPAGADPEVIARMAKDNVVEPPKKDEAKPEPKEEEKPKTDDKEEEASEEFEVEETEDEKDEAEPKGRPVKFVPAWKVEVERKRFEKQIADLTAKAKADVKSGDATETKVVEDIKQLADKWGVKDEFLKEFTESILTKVKLPDDIQGKLTAFEEAQRKQKEEEGFNNEYSSVAKEFPELDAPEVKAKLRRLAYTEEYARYKLKDIYLLNKEHLVTARKVSAEAGKGGTSAGSVDFDNVTAEQVANMDKTTFEAFSNYMAKKGGNRLMFTKK